MLTGWRALTIDDLPALAVLEAASDVADGERFPTTLDDLAAQLLTPDLDLSTMSVGIEEGEAGLIGWCGLEPRLGGATWNRVHVHGSVHPRARGRGHGRALLAWAEDRGSTVLAEAAPDRPDLADVLTVHAAEPAVGRARLQERCGFRLVRWYVDMFRPLDTPLSVHALPAGCAFTAWRDDRDADFFDADQAAFAGAWGSAPWSYELWRHEYADDSGFRPDLTVGVERDGRIVGHVMVAAYESIADEAGRTVAWLARLGVRPEHRGQGIAAAAITRVLTLSAEAGFATAGLDVDTENVSGALRLYERLGFRPIKRLALRGKTVRAGTGPAAVTGTSGSGERSAT